MTNVLSRSFPPPRNWQEFERLCYDVYSRFWQTSDAAMNGRIGQSQAGVDVYGHDRRENAFVGVQCKGKDQSYGSALTESELRDEVDKAKSFVPKLDVFVLATTAPNDQAIQTFARELSEEHKKAGLFEVRVEGWTTISQRITDFEDLIRKYFSDLAPFDVVERIDAGIAITRAEGEETRAVIERNQATLLSAIERADPGDPLQNRVAALAKIVEDGSPEAGLKALERLWTAEAAKASPRNRYRIRANIGFAKLMLGHKAQAIADLRTSAAEDPAWPPAQAVLATAELLDDQKGEAYATAKRALAADSSAHQASLVLLEAAPDTVSLAELEKTIPLAHRERADILLGFARRARILHDDAARVRYLSEASDRHGHDWRVLEAQAEPLLERIFAVDGIVFTHVVPADLVADLNRAIDLLQQSWAIISNRDNVLLGAHVAANLLAALDIAGRAREYEQLLTDTLNVAPEFPPILRRYARRMIEADDWASVAKAVNRIPIEDVELPDRLLKIQARLHLGEAREALADALALELEFPGDRTGEIAAALQIEAAFAAKVMDDVVDDVLARWPTSVLLRSIAHNNFPEDHPRRAALLAEIGELAKSLNDPSDRIHAADALYGAKQFSAAADMYAPLYVPDKDTPMLFRGLKALFFAERRREARELFERLSPEIKAMARYADLGVAIYEHSGLLVEALGLMDQNLARDDALIRRLHWLSLSERIGNQAAITAWLESVSRDVVGMPQELMQLALAIDRHLHDPKCFPIAYRALRAAYSDPDLHAIYVIALVIMGRTRQAANGFQQPDTVAPDTAVLLSEKDGPRKLVRILETASDPKIERGEIAPDTELWPRLIGRRVGDEIEIPSVGISPNTYVIREIRDKYLHAHFRSLEEFESLFPGHHALGSFVIDESKGDEKFKPLFDSLKRRAEFAKELTDLYRGGQTALMLLARFSGVSPCEAWDWVVAHPDLGLRTCVGMAQEFSAARDALAKNRKAVIDPITLYGLTRLGIADTVRCCFDDLGVVQTTLDFFRRLAAERAVGIGKKHGTMSWDGTHYRMIELDDAYHERKVEEAKAALAFAESLTLLPAEPSQGVSQTVRDIFAESDSAFLDTLYAVQGSGRVFCCDDHVLRMLAREATGCDGVWTQPAAIRGMLGGTLSSDTYFDVVGALVGADYRLTAIDYRATLHQLAKDGWATTATTEMFALQLALSSNEPQSLLRLVADIAQFGWPEKPDVVSYVRFFRVLFNAFRHAQPERDQAKLVLDITSILQSRFRHNAIRIVLKRRLRDSTYTRPATAIVTAVFDTADEFAIRIGNVLSTARV